MHSNPKTPVRSRRYIFCDTFRQKRLATLLPAFVTRRAALWCPDFPPTNLAVHRWPPRMQQGQPALSLPVVNDEDCFGKH